MPPDSSELHNALERLGAQIKAAEKLLQETPGATLEGVSAHLLRFYDGLTGEIRLDGANLENLPRKWLRAHIGVIMQEPFLYSKTVSQNIALAPSG